MTRNGAARANVRSRMAREVMVVVVVVVMRAGGVGVYLRLRDPLAAYERDGRVGAEDAELVSFQEHRLTTRGGGISRAGLVVVACRWWS